MIKLISSIVAVGIGLTFTGCFGDNMPEGNYKCERLSGYGKITNVKFVDDSWDILENREWVVAKTKKVDENAEALIKQKDETNYSLVLKININGTDIDTKLGTFSIMDKEANIVTLIDKGGVTYQCNNY